MIKIVWTEAYYGIRHARAERISTAAASEHWCTVHDDVCFAELLRRFPGRGLSPLHSYHTTAESAREAGEKWLREVTP